MGELSVLVGKTMETLKSDGPFMVAKKASRYLKAREDRRNCNKPDRTFADVLYINGCFLPHPSRYRVTHQREQLWAGDISSNEVFYTQLTLSMVRLYRVFIFFRCPYTRELGAFIRKAKECNKVVLYDIDDLMFDRCYTNTISYVKKMPQAERKKYENGIKRNQKTLKMCDGAVTTTERLAAELKRFVPNVYINRNTASEEMVQLSEQALQKARKKSTDKVRLGYFSGSITHNADFEMILPVLLRLMRAYRNLELVIAGELDCPQALKAFEKRVECVKFLDWKKLPEKLTSVDINLAPLEQTVFNEAKSENKWVESALVKVPTIASRTGAFARMIEHGVTGILCDTQKDWEMQLRKMIEDASLRHKIGKNAYEYCRKHCTSIYTGAAFADYIRSVMRPNIVFILPVLQISGGALVILKHCAMMKEAGYDAAVMHQGDETQEWVEKDGTQLAVIPFRNVSVAAYLDKAVATLWSTVGFLHTYSKIGEKYYNVQNFETDFYLAGNGFRIDANRTYCMRSSVHYITISKWCQDWLKNNYGKDAAYAPNGIDTAKFYPIRRDWSARKIRILVEGNSEDYYKNVDESFRIVDLLEKETYEIWYLSYLGKPKDNYRVDRFFHKVPYEKVAALYRQCDILLKSSILESFSYPPLEMMATGGYVVAAPNEGNIEYLQDEENCLFYEHANLHTAVHAIERIIKDGHLQKRLYANGIRAAKEREWEYVRKKILKLYGAEMEEYV